MHGRHGYAGRRLNLLKTEPFPSQAAQFGHHVRGQRRATGGFAAAGLARFDAFGEAYPFLLGDSGQKANDCLAEHTRAVEVLLGEGLELHAGRREPLQVVERFGHALAAEAVEAPEQHHVEAALVGIGEELLELRPLSAAAAFLVAVLLIDGVAQPLGKGAQFAQLVVVRLAFVFGRDAGVDGNIHYTTVIQ